MERNIEEIEHMLMHALTEDSIAERIEQAVSQQEVYDLMKELPYFDLSLEEFQAGIIALQSKDAE
ncbi:hypothetical protein [Selenomonas sp. KH1T6]|jgi:hypothetical protein|uniref:hypothetical protein n=1 Tax=Selenomonas sp. KH1T6 TaxID=3158784 RepID=UPI0008A76E74|nr:hypothetical protein SAMN05216583_13910 [Selenomonas ruminantium]